MPSKNEYLYNIFVCEYTLSPCDVMAKILDCEFELQLRYDIHLLTNNLGKGMNFIP